MTPRCTLLLPPELAAAQEELAAAWQRDHGIARLWAFDAALWTNRNEYLWLDWLTAPERELARLDLYRALAAEARTAQCRDALLIGMGGASLAPSVLASAFGRVYGHPALRVLDSTDPAEVAAADRDTAAGRTLVIVSSKSGRTLETDLLRSYFQAREAAVAGSRGAGARFIAITDPDSTLDTLARSAGYRRILHGVPGIGGRFSALSPFGLAPAAMAGVDVEPLLQQARAMAAACGPGRPLAENPGFAIGAAIGAAALRGRDKLTVIATPQFAALGPWLEQLLAESTGKQGKGVVPVVAEPALAPDAYGSDRFFVHLRSAGLPMAAQDAVTAPLVQRGHPVARIDLRNAFDLGAEFYRWCFATAVASSVIGVNPFDQPDVEASKAETRRLMASDAAAPDGDELVLLAESDGIQARADPTNAGALQSAAGGTASAAALLTAHLARARAGECIALLAYLPRNRVTETQMAGLRSAIAARYGVATCAGFGPRFLHSSGQLYKGGPNHVIVVQITADVPNDLAIPGSTRSFGQVEAAQAMGDFAVLAQRGRRLLWLHAAAPDRVLAQLADAVA